MNYVLLCMPASGSTQPPPPPDGTIDRKLHSYIIERPTTVLVVDDDDGIRHSLVGLLTDAGYVVEEAADGLEGLQKALRGPRPDLVLLDIMMPVLNGIGMLRALEFSARSDVPILIISAYANYREDVAEPRYVFVDKPFSAEVILDQIERKLKHGRPGNG